ncbi:hypothetical protein [Azospirillum lipoferum]|uniref:DUF4376 domain-containing protein n=1 Tax=Azospirillum lipoferum (strain 4B) TaxID=862719 RepID=G7Z7R0_AZOL4|nr:hypothetical protein [Azospirillum lipoferum]CBS87024.1 protein of unknown function [Azospirillum lipoferum 4B]
MDIFETVPSFDASTHRQATTYVDTPDPDNDRIVRVWGVEPIPPEEIAAALAAARALAVTANNEAAGRAREAYLTAVPGQATTYAAKQAEVGRWVDAGRPADAAADAYPWAGDRAERRAVTVAQVLTEWDAVTAAWESVGRLIECERERVNEAIAAAGTVEAIQAARDSAAYPTP